MNSVAQAQGEYKPHALSFARNLMRDVIKKLSLRANEKLVMYALSDHMSAFGDNIWPSVKTIAKETSLGTATVSRVLARLRKDQLLEVQSSVRLFVLKTGDTVTAPKGGRESTRYQFGKALRDVLLRAPVAPHGDSPAPSAVIGQPYQGDSRKRVFQESKEEKETKVVPFATSTGVPTERAKTLLDAFMVRWTHEYKKPYPRKATDAIKANAHVTELADDDFADQIDAYFTSTDAYYRTAEHPFALFTSQIHKFWREPDRYFEAQVKRNAEKYGWVRDGEAR